METLLKNKKVKIMNHSEKTMAYVAKTSQHLFQINNRLVTYFVKNDSIYSYSTNMELSDEKISKITYSSIAKMQEYYLDNTKCVIKHMLFLNKKAKGVKYFKKFRLQFEEYLTTYKF